MKQYGNQCESDSAFTKKARMLQSIYRVEIGEAEGIGPRQNSKKYYGNMISGGEVSGKNFLMKETFEYARQRVEHLGKDETIDAFRLFNNLLSSMPMAFNLFHPLMLLLQRTPDVVTSALQQLFTAMPIHQVTEIGLEYIPTPIEKYTKDKSAMDAYIKFVDANQGQHIIAIETKYTDVLGTNEAKKSDEQKQLLIQTGIFRDEFASMIQEGKVKLTQIYRNVLLTERYRIVDGLTDSYSVVLAPSAHPSTQKELQSVVNYLKPEYAYKLSAVSLEDFVDVLLHHLPEEDVAVFERFRQRYLDFEKVDR